MATNYNRYQKRKRGPSDPAKPRQFQFPVGNANQLELYKKIAEVTSWIPVELPGLWEENAASKPWYTNPIRKRLRDRRRLQPEDTAMLLLDIHSHVESDTEFTGKVIASVQAAVEELQRFVRNVVIMLTPGDEEGGKCYLTLNTKLRAALETPQCRLTPTYEEEINGEIENQKWPTRTTRGAWTTTEVEAYMKVIIQAEAQRYHRRYQEHVDQPRIDLAESPHWEEGEYESEGRQAANRYKHRDQFPEVRSMEDKLREELQEQRETIRNLKTEVEKLNRKLSRRSGAGSERKKLRKMILNMRKKSDTSSSESSDDSTGESNITKDCAERNPEEEAL